MNPIAAGFGSDIDDRVPDPRRFRVENVVCAGEANRHGIHEDIAVIGLVEIDFPADGRDAHAIAVAADAGDDAGDQVACLRMARLAKPQCIQVRDGPRTHGEHIAHDAADASCRALIGFDEARVVMAFNLEDGGVAIANVDYARVLTRPLDDLRPFGGQSL